MNINERIAEALQVSHEIDPAGQAPNVVYMGRSEWNEMVVGASEGSHVLIVPERIIGLLVVPVNLGSWLQVANVEGVK